MQGKEVADEGEAIESCVKKEHMLEQMNQADSHIKRLIQRQIFNCNGIGLVSMALVPL